MKKTFFAVALLLAAVGASAQQAYWVFLADKAGTTFDPYTYFDAKAIERYNACGADLYDISNYPVSAAYEQGVAALATEEVGCSRWMNAVGVMATAEQASRIAALPYVLRVQPLAEGGMTLAAAPADEDGLLDYATVDGPLEAQLVRMGGKHFRDRGIDGKGIRVAVFDGGFPRVNTHEAFRHLRENKQILKTWNFPNKKENVYGWNSHGTMTLSCIAGRIDGKDLGLATGAEFLLARTEVEAEPFKEEVWWQMAVEWADKNGANIISSSLGYGKERHYTKDMDGTSYVAKAGNLAARKGMLVCNSAGNEADDSQWQTIITPADADSVLCVGGIENSLTEYNHIEFSSFGPSYDGRLKPNVSAFGYARTANVTNDNATHYVHGTSFSCPLVAGFAACAWQASPGKTAMEMFRALEQSADLYPYYDYAFGYGVPQAAFFTGDARAAEPTFRFVEGDNEVSVVPLKTVTNATIFYHYRNADGTLAYYGSHRITYMSDTMPLSVNKRNLVDRTLAVHLGGYTATYTLPADEQQRLRDGRPWSWQSPSMSRDAVAKRTLSRGGRDAFNTSDWGSNAKYRMDYFFMLGLPAKLEEAEMPMLAWSPAIHLGVRWLRAFGKSYCLGIGAEWANTTYNLKGMQPTALEGLIGMAGVEDAMDKTRYRRVAFNEFSVELFQRVRLVAIGLFGKGLHWDLGVYGSYGGADYQVKGVTVSGEVSHRQRVSLIDLYALDAYHWNYGVTTRLTYDVIGLYARYRLNGIGQKPADGKALLPRLEVGLQLSF